MRRRRLANNEDLGFPRSSRKRYIIPGILSVLLISVGLFSAYIVHAYKYELPPIERLYNIEPSLVTRIYARDGSVFQKYFSEQRNLIPLDRIPKQMIDALLSTEDRNFYSHWGVSSKDLMRAVVMNIIHGFGSQGASTITQQLARMLFLDREMSVGRKIKEALTAIKIERLYSKDEILEMYLNQYDFGNRSFGVSEAARNYFNKDVEDLKIEEAALLAGLIKAPYRYSPMQFPERALTRRNAVLEGMAVNGKISHAAADSLKKIPIKVDLSNRPGIYGEYFSEYIRQYLISKYGDSTVYSGGLSVYTALDPYIQKVAENSIKEQTALMQARIDSVYTPRHPDYKEYMIKVLDEAGDSIGYRHVQIQGACAVLENGTGDVLAMVGGKDYEESKFNRAIQSLLQPGSSFKPFVYTAAIDNGYTPCQLMWDTPVVYTIPGSDEWRPHNFDDEFMGKMSLRRGFYLSRNLIAIKLINMVQPQQAIFYAQKMGISTKLTPDLSLAIGTSPVRLIDITSAYSVFPEGGIKVKPRFIYKIVDRYGNILEQNSISEREEVLRPQTAYIMVDMMKSVLDEPDGTGHNARGMGFLREAGGKTGTSNAFCDNWFIGFTPQMTCGVWLGFDSKISLGKNQTGGKNALPVWTKIMIAAHENIPADIPESHFKIPEGIVFANICYDSGEIATDKCVNVGREVFTESTLPKKHCHLHPSRGLYAFPDKKDFNLNQRDTISDGIPSW